MPRAAPVVESAEGLPAHGDGHWGGTKGGGKKEACVLLRNQIDKPTANSLLPRDADS